MCGRYNVIDDPFTQDLLEELGIQMHVETRYNIAPTEDVQVVLSEDGSNRLRHMRWWLIPSWVKEPGTKYSMFNARADHLAESPAFRGPLRHQRCIIPASSFIEWRQEGDIRQPYDIRPVHGAVAFAGLWDHWGHGDETIYSCTLITTDATPGMEQIHNRQPVMLPRDALQRWLDPAIDGRDLMTLLQPGLPEALEAVPVDARLNNSRYKHPPAPLVDREKLTIEAC